MCRDRNIDVSIDFRLQLLSILSINCDNEWDASDLIMLLTTSCAEGETMKLMQSSLDKPRQIEHVGLSREGLQIIVIDLVLVCLWSPIDLI